MLQRQFLRNLALLLPPAMVGFDRDAIGLQIARANDSELSSLLVAYEVTDAVVREANALGASLLVAYHPLIFPNVSELSDSTRSGRLAAELIRSEIALYVVHTTLDTNQEIGTSRLMADALGLRNPRAIQPLRDALQRLVVYTPDKYMERVMQQLSHDANGTTQNPFVSTFAGEGKLEVTIERWNLGGILRRLDTTLPPDQYRYEVVPILSGHPMYGMGTLGNLKAPASTPEFLQRIQQTFGTPVLRHSDVQPESISCVALVGGSGMDYYDAAKSAGADAFVTADLRYHDFHRAANDGILLVDAGHSETEKFVPAAVAGVARRALEASQASTDVVHIAQSEQNGVRYFVGS